MTTLSIPCAQRNLALLRRKLAGPYGLRFSHQDQIVLVSRVSAMVSMSPAQPLTDHCAQQGA